MADCEESQRLPAGIDGVWLQPLKIIPTPDGPVLHMLRQGYALMPDFPQGFGEIYFSEILPGHIKAWKLHHKQTQLFAAPMGLIKLILCDARPNSPDLGKRITILLGRPDHYSLLQIPPGIWYGFQAISATPALICNCANLPHDPAEAEKIALNAENAPCKWE